MVPVILQLLPGEFAICQLAADEPVPHWAGSTVYSCVMRTHAELSVMCPAAQVPAGVRHERGWRLFRFEGPFPFSETGIMASVLVPLASVGVSVLAQASFDTDYIFIKTGQVDSAVHALAAAGHVVRR